MLTAPLLNSFFLFCFLEQVNNDANVINLQPPAPSLWERISSFLNTCHLIFMKAFFSFDLPHVLVVQCTRTDLMELFLSREDACDYEWFSKSDFYELLFPNSSNKKMKGY
jgi:hypothetical protein